MEKLPEIKPDEQLTTKTNAKSYKMADGATSSNSKDESNEPEAPRAVKEPDLSPPACLTDKSNDLIPNEYIAKWTVSDANKTQRISELKYNLKVLKSKKMEELVTNAKIYDKSFYLLSRGMYRTHNQKAENRKLILETLLQNDIIKLLVDYWNAMMAEFDLKKKEANPSFSNGQLWDHYILAQQHIVDSLNNIYHMLVVLWNGSDMEIQEILNKIYNGCITSVLKWLDVDLYPLETKEIKSQSKAVKACLAIIHNFCNKLNKAIPELREKDALRIVGKYRNSGLGTLKIKSILAYSYLISENDGNKSVIELEIVDIKILMAALRDALDSKDLHSPKFGYHAEELFVGLNNIAVVDSNKKRLVDAGVLPFYVESMGKPNKLLQAASAQGVWILAFDDKSTEKIKAEPRLLDALGNLAKSDVGDVTTAAKGALWKLEGESQHLQQISTKKSSTNKKIQHVMISYQWDVQPEVVKIRERLRKAGYRVWIDIEQMANVGETLTAMAKAVENCCVIVPILTEKYKKSPACQQELKYAKKLQKKLVPIRLQPKYIPDGWLGLVIEDRFFYDLTKPTEYEPKLKEFFSAIGNDGIIEKGEDVNPVYEEAEDEMDTEPLGALGAPGFSGNSSTIFNVTSLKCVGWGPDQVAAWLKRNDLEKYVKKFAGLNGRLLAELAAVQFISPDAYYPMVKQEHGMSMLDILKLNAALRELN